MTPSTVKMLRRDIDRFVPMLETKISILNSEVYPSMSETVTTPGVRVGVGVTAAALLTVREKLPVSSIL